MAKFYQPKETNGAYDAASHTFTVNQGDRALIGFTAVSTKEMLDTTVDASENVILARYSISNLSIELDIDTRKSTAFVLTATQEVAMSAKGKDMTRPLNVVINPPLSAGSAVGQQHDPAGCWAACLSYFLSVAPDRQSRRFIDVVGDFNGIWDATGFMNTSRLLQQLAAQRKRYRMAARTIKPDGLDAILGRWPILIGFKHPGGFGHMNVIVSASGGNVRAMDPWSPDPPPNSITREQGQIVFNGANDSFQFVGTFITKPVGYYKSPMRSGTILVGYPEEYDKRIP